jgi:hypothetical protein
MTATIDRELRLPSSAGLATTPSTAKVAYDWVQALCFLAIAIVGTVVWSILTRARHHRALHARFRMLVRYFLGTVLLLYGFAKVWKAQFPAPDAIRLLQPFGEASPMGRITPRSTVARPAQERPGVTAPLAELASASPVETKSCSWTVLVLVLVLVSRARARRVVLA